MTLTLDHAARFAAIALGHVTREYPNVLSHRLLGPEDARTPRELHPVFYGSLDWHSCVHGYWMLARLLRRVPGLPQAGAIRALFDAHLTPDAVAGECDYLERGSPGFERPYGWAWLLALAAELNRHDDRRWADAVRPLAAMFTSRFKAFLPRATYPVRAGTHGNTAFALLLAGGSGDPGLLSLFRDTAQRWYEADADCQAWEPSGDDFLSSALIEAACMARLHPGGFPTWFARFLPRIAAREPAALFQPATVSDRSDGKIAHLDGLNLSRAWCWRLLARTLPQTDPRRPVMEQAAEAHLGAALPHLADDYMGEHWLASFAVLALDATDWDREQTWP